MNWSRQGRATLLAICLGTLPLFGAGRVLAGGRVLTAMDVVTIRIVDAPDLNATARVEPDGSIAFPYLGRIRAAGLTADELARRIEQGLIARKILAGP